MLEALFLCVLSVSTVAVVVWYSRRMIEIRSEYSRARTIIEDIVVSFNRELKNHEAKLDTTTSEINSLYSREEGLAQRLEKWEGRVRALADKPQPSPEWEAVQKKLESLEVDLGSTKDTLLKKLSEFEKLKSPREESDMKIESAIPIKREKALAPLTETELRVLELLAHDGEKTSPEIKTEIRLSREHTARLMKKLYEGGYLERSANRIPFTYRLKEEMHKILRNPEQKG